MAVMKKTPLYISQLLIVVSCLWGFTPTTKTELQEAVDLWVDDNATALSTYGEIIDAGGMNGDGILNVLDVVMLVDNILNP